MTNEEAQIIIGNIPIKPEVLDDCYDITEYQEAKAMAIEALAQESITWIVGKNNCQVAVRNMPIDKMKKICAIIGEAEQQPCEDMRDATEEERKSTKDYIYSISNPTGLQFDDIYEELDFVQSHKKLSANLQPCEDCVSKENALNSLIATDLKGWQLAVALEAIEKLPPVTPSYNSVKTELNCILDRIITQIEQTRDKDKLCEYPYNRCINIIKEKIKYENNSNGKED